MYRLVLLRHGESEWNRENRFTGWVDVDLSAKGRDEAREAGQLMKGEKYEFDVALCHGQPSITGHYAFAQPALLFRPRQRHLNEGPGPSFNFCISGHETAPRRLTDIRRSP